jgi:hypothetical protein
VEKESWKWKIQRKPCEIRMGHAAPGVTKVDNHLTVS